MRFAAASALAAALMFAAPLPLSAQNVDNGSSDFAKKAGNFLKNCDARADENGKRPDPPNYVCLAFLAGLVEGYNYGAIANGNEKPYCLPRPVSLAELSDMLVTVIERGVKPDMATAAVFHFLMQETFKCKKDASLLDEGEKIIVLAQASEQLLRVTPPSEVEANQPKLRIVAPSNGSSGPLLPIVDPASTSRPTGAEADSAPSSGTPGTSATPGTTSSTGTSSATQVPLLQYPPIASPTRPTTPSRPAVPQGPRRVGS